MAVTADPRVVVENFYRRFNVGEWTHAAFFHPEIEWLATRRTRRFGDALAADSVRGGIADKTEQPKEEGQGQCSARPCPDDAGMRRFAVG